MPSPLRPLEPTLRLTREDVLELSPTPPLSLRSAMEEYTRLLPIQRTALRTRHSRDTDRTVFYDLKLIDAAGFVRRNAVGVIVTMDGTSLFVETVKDSVDGEWKTTVTNLSLL